MKTIQRIGFFLLLLVCGLLVFVVFSHYSPIFSGNTDKAGRIVAAGIFLALAIFTRELGLPAVVGCGNATTLLKTGDLIRVDGGAGMVELKNDMQKKGV